MLIKLITYAGLFSLILLATGCVSQTPLPTVEPSPEVEVEVDRQLDGDTVALAWSYQADNPINDTPMRVGDVVIAAPVGGPLLALDVNTGELRWQYAPPGKLWERSYASDGQRVFVGTEGGQLFALNVENGEVVWHKDLGINVQIGPYIVADVLYAPTTYVGPGLKAKPDGKARLFALLTTDGSEIWSFETDNYILQTPFYDNNRLYVAGSYSDPSIEVDEGGPMRMYALSAQDGSPQWVYESEDGFVKAVYATNKAITYIAYQDFVSGLDAQNGNLLWRKDTGNWVPSLSGTDDTLYFGSANTVVHALDMNTGETLWQYNIGGGSFNYLLGTPVREADKLYFLTQKGGIIALNAADGTLQWQIETGITGSRDGLSVSDGWIFIGDGEGNVYGFTNIDK